MTATTTAADPATTTIGVGRRRPGTWPQRILDYLTDCPGATAAQVESALAAPKGTVHRRLAALRAQGTVRREAAPGRPDRWYPADQNGEAGCSAPEQQAPTWKQAVLAFVRAHPGHTTAGIEAELGAPRNTVYRHLNAFADAGLVRRVYPDVRKAKARWFPADDVRQTGAGGDGGVAVPSGTHVYGGAGVPSAQAVAAAVRAQVAADLHTRAVVLETQGEQAAGRALREAARAVFAAAHVT